MTEPKGSVVMPLGRDSGRTIKLADALVGVAIEMLAQRSDLLILADRKPSEVDSECDRRRAADLERYATAINAIALQVDPDRWDPETMGGLLTMARQNSVTLPGWMTNDEPQELGGLA